MALTRLRLSGPSVDDLSAQLLAEHGPRARIVSAERVTVGGIAGLFARRYFEVMVELPDVGGQGSGRGSDRASGRGSHIRIDGPARVGIAALLDEADREEATLHGETPEPSLSTGSPAFADLMDDLSFHGLVVPDPDADADAGSATGAGAGADGGLKPAAVGSAPTAPPSPRPKPLTRPGDLVVIVGLAADPIAVARSMAKGANSSAVRAAGRLTFDGSARVEDRRAALACRAAGVERDEATFVACGWDERASGILSAIQPDQVWVAVDVSRKPEDTARWVASVTAVLPVQGVAVLGRAETASPETVEELGLPVGWVDGAPVGDVAGG